MGKQIGNYLLRPMEIEDLTAVLKIEQLSKPTPWNEQSYRQELDNPNSHPTLLMADEKPVGYIVWWLIADEIQIQTIAVDPNWRGRRLGQLLLHQALQNGINQGAVLSTLDVRASNLVAQALYHKYRYQTVGQRKRYYRDGETAYLMTAEFAAVPPTYQSQLDQLHKELPTANDSTSV